jgi:hypothetical protein
MEGFPTALSGPVSFGPSFFLSLLFGMIGMGYFMYGKNQKNGLCMIVGIVLGVYPYFISNTFAIVAMGVLLMAAPFYIK